MVDRTVSIAVDTDTGTKRKHFNAENISFVQAQYSELTRLAHALIWGIPVVTLVLLVRETNTIVALLASGALWVALSAMLFVPDEMRVATVTDTYDLEEDVEGIESQFLNAADEVITVEGSNSSRYNEYRYRYHVVPPNVVSVDHKPTDPFPLPAILAVLGVAAVLLGVWADLLAQGAVLGAIGLGLAVYTDSIPRPDELTVEYGTGEEATFEMTSPDATEFVTAFKDPQGGQVTVGTGLDEDDAFDTTPDFDDEQTRAALTEFRERTVGNLISENAASLRSDDPGEREFGVAAMYPFRVDIPEYREAVGPLLSLLTDTAHVQFRSLIGSILQRVARRAPHHFDESTDRLTDLLSHPDPEVRGHAVEIAAELVDNPDTPAQIRQTLDRELADTQPVDDIETDLDEEIRSDLRAVLDDLLSTYVAKLYSPDPSERQLGLVIATSYRTDIEAFEQLVAPLFSAVRESEDPQFRDEATDVLVRAAQNSPRHFADTVDDACDLLTHADPSVREDAVTMLTALADHYPDRIAQHRQTLDAGLNDGDIQTDVEYLMQEVGLQA
ncbi:hypothetical protein SAMN05216226_11242 [Halovenus aranensis]|uniref:HEAT repeat-containing protein n=1 Tax=Halovenus aranensis TaxID=890420 RepID=A0A1G8XRK6_9EURY|nr:hypothetical protein [Halovenus aranensis]SDJ93189.1 hypothetical protein SAMN05216226_11242 [Halovenus aranensis]